MKRIFNISRRMPGIRSMAAAAALGIMPVATGSAQAQTVFMDDFDDAWDYSFGSVPSGGIWTGGYNFGDGGPHDSGITVPGHLTMGLDGVAWEENITTGPMQYVIIDASQPFSVTIKISSQTAGALSQAG